MPAGLYVRRLTALHRPADDTAGVEVDHDCQIGEAFQRPDVGDVHRPDPVWCFHVELPVQGVVDDHGWFAAIAVRPALVADLGLVIPAKLARRATRLGQHVWP